MFHNYTITIYNIGYNYNIAIYLYSRFLPLNSQIGAWPKISASTALSFKLYGVWSRIPWPCSAKQNSGGNNKIKAKLGINKQILTYLLLKDHNFAALPNDWQILMGFFT